MNKVFLIGRLSKEPELRYTQSGKAVCSINLAVDRRHQGEGQGPSADFIPCIVWGNLGEAVANNLSKGRKISVEGRLQVRSYNAQDGTKRYITEVVGSEVEFLDSRPNGGGGAPAGGNNPGGFGGTPVPDDDIPF